MNIQFPTLTADQIEVKVKQIGEKGAVLLLYKTARTDMELLDSVVGPMNWECQYSEIKGNLYCSIGIYYAELDKTVWKMDCGIESREDDEGNQKKGEASDAFKRAGFRWGIGRELYTSPFTFAFVPTQKNTRGNWELVDRFMRFSVKHIAYDDQRRVSELQIVDNKGNIVFSFPNGQRTPQKSQPKQPTNTMQDRRGLITAEQVRYIKQTCSAEEIGKLCSKYGVAQLSDMNELYAAGIIKKLQERNEAQ